MPISARKTNRAFKMNSGSSGKSTTENGNERRPSIISQPKEQKVVNPLSQEMLQGNFSSVLKNLEATRLLTENGAFTSYLMPPSVILNSLHLVLAYIESPIGKALVTLESSKFLQLYNMLGSSLLEVRKDYSPSTTETQPPTTSQCSTGSPEEELLTAASENMEASALMKDTPETTEAQEEQQQSNTTSTDSPSGGSTTAATENQERSEMSGEQAEKPSGSSSSDRTDKSSTMSWSKRAMRAFLQRLASDGSLILDERDTERIVENKSGKEVVLTKAMSRADYHTWTTMKVTEQDDEENQVEKTVHVLVKGKVNFLEVGGPTNDRAELCGFDENDKRPLKVIKFDRSAKQHDIRYVDYESYWAVKCQLIGDPIHNHTLARIKTLVTQHLKQTKCAHVDARTYFTVVLHTAYAILIPTKEDELMLNTLGRKENVRRIGKVNDFVREGKVTRKRWFRLDKKVEAVPKQ